MADKTPLKSGEFLVSEKIQDNVWIEINLSNLLHNFELIRETVGAKTGIMGVVKSNAYGHGLVEISKFLSDRVDMLGVASLKEALALRQAGIKTPIFIFGYIFPHEVEECVEKNLSISISSLDQARALHHRFAGVNKMLRIHVKIDTGMGRMGLLARDAKNDILEISQLSGFLVEGLMTHFAVSDNPDDPFTNEQIKLFGEVLEHCEQHGMYFLYKHAANSAAIFSNSRSHFNLVRPGISLYGVDPFKQESKSPALKPVMSLKAKVHLVKKLPAGHTVSYGRNFTVPKDGYVAILPAGYGHGIPYNLTGKSKARVLIGGKPYPICGNICMDYTMAYLGENHGIRPGDEAVFVGAQGKESITAKEITSLYNSIPYEMLTRLSGDIERWYVD